MHKTVIINVFNVGMLRIDMIYLGGTLRRKKRMSSKEKRAKNAEKLLRNYMLKRYRNLSLEVVDEERVEKTIRKYSETISKRRVLK